MSLVCVRCLGYPAVLTADDGGEYCLDCVEFLYSKRLIDLSELEAAHFVSLLKMRESKVISDAFDSYNDEFNRWFRSDLEGR